MSRHVDRDTVVDAFDSAVDYWHAQLDEQITEHTDTDRPDTAREYFEDGRGYDTDTVDEWRLGWAPGDGGLYDHLRSEGFDAETISATGLFCQKAPKKELWRGRYVLPYFSSDGRAEYAIARCTGSKGGGSAGYDGHSEDFLAGKYAKVAHTRENVPLSEPILGLHTLDAADEVVVAEGIADAISATEAGYAVLSPVTKEFKREHFEAVVDAVEQHDIKRVYVVPDAEQASFSEIDSDDVPDEPEHIYEAITQPAVAPGPGGGLRTANYLVENGVDARLVELPRPSGGKVDLDDYIQKWKQPLGPVLRSAKSPKDHAKYEEATATQSVDTDERASRDELTNHSENPPRETPQKADSASGLFGLDVGDVNPELEAGYRGKNPLGHTGNSENYFTVYEVDGTLFGKDYKRPGTPVYNGVTYLLVEIGERQVEGPTGELSPRETWKAWEEARKRGLLGESDIIPEKALRHVADEQELYDLDKLPELTNELPPKAHNRALWWVNTVWAKEHLHEDEDDNEDATARRGKPRTAVVQTWEDVRYIYDESKQNGRKAARDLLSDRYDFMTVAGTEKLQLYDPETGVFTDQTGVIRGEIYEELGEHWTTHELNEIQAGLRQQSVVQPRHLDAGDTDRPLICVGNGVLDVFDRELHEHSPEYHFVNRVPVDYNEDAETETYTEFVDDLVDREDRRETLFEMVGHALLPDANERYKKFLILTGDADNGKSMFYDAVSSLLNGPAGEENNTAAVKLAKLAQNRFSLNSMYGSLANIAGEIDGKMIRNTANLKDITGGDEVEIEPKGADSFFDTVGTTLMFAANDPPILGERDKKAIATRLVPVELPYTFTDEPSGDYEKQRVPEDELRADLENDEALSGFLNLALDGLERLEANHGDVSLKETPEERLELYEREADPMREFGTVALENHPENYIVKADIVTLYKQFATEQGYEVGSAVEKVLHHALRGVPDLNYTDSQPRSPDYSDTSLPLQGWDTRKRVINRVTLTEEGMKLAENAGLIEDNTDADEEPEYIQAGELDLARDVSDRETLPPIRGTIAAVWEDRFGNAVAELVDDQGSVDIQIVAFGADDVPLSAGVEYELSGLRARNAAGEQPYVEFRPTSSTKKLTDPEQDDLGDMAADTRQTASTDGGDGNEQATDDTDEEPEATLQGQPLDEPILTYVSEADGDVDHSDLVDHLKERGAADSQISHWIEKLLTRGSISEPEVGTYR